MLRNAPGRLVKEIKGIPTFAAEGARMLRTVYLKQRGLVGIAYEYIAYIGLAAQNLSLDKWIKNK